MIGFGPNAEVAALIQMATLGTWCGLLVTLWRRRRDPDADSFTPAAWGTVVGGLLGVAILLLDALA